MAGLAESSSVLFSFQCCVKPMVGSGTQKMGFATITKKGLRQGVKSKKIKINNLKFLLVWLP
jgi:hypothetical protein